MYAAADTLIALAGVVVMLLSADPDVDGLHRMLWEATWQASVRLGLPTGWVDGVMGWLGCLSAGRFYTLFLPLALVAWPWVTLAALLVFAQSMGRAKVRKVHVLRCVVYSGDVMVTAAAGAIGFAAVADVVYIARPLTATLVDAWMLLGGVAAFWAVANWRLFRAYQLYLRFHRPLVTVLAAQVLVLLVCLFVATQIWSR
jgi:hypothetical protein